MTMEAIHHGAEQRRKPAPRSTQDRNAGQFTAKWSNARAALIGYLHGKGWNGEDIARHLGDGTSGGTIRAAVQRRYHLPAQPSRASVLVPMTLLRKSQLLAEAERRGLEPEELVGRILHMTIEGDLVGAVLDE